jgi:hypothetical protein
MNTPNYQYILIAYKYENGNYQCVDYRNVETVGGSLLKYVAYLASINIEWDEITIKKHDTPGVITAKVVNSNSKNIFVL